MTTTNATAVAAVYDDTSGGALFAVLAPEVVWHFPGSSWLGGRHEGTDAVARLFITLAQVTEGTFSSVPRHIVGDDEYVVSVVDASLTFRGTTFTSPVAVVWRFEGDRVVEVREHVYDVAGLDAFWAGERPDGW